MTQRLKPVDVVVFGVGMVGSIVAKEVRPDLDVVSVDELRLSDFDYIDIGAEIKHVQAVPVIIKSLVFRPEHPQPIR